MNATTYERCPLTELMQSDCAHCRRIPDPPELLRQVGGWFQAGRPGSCVECGFCGAGGSSIGLDAAGFELKLAANHWQRAIDTHQANFPDAEHRCADINNYDMRRLPTTDILWASPICTEISPAGGRQTGYKRSTQSKAGQMDLLQEHGHVAQEGFERTRATFHDIIRATEVHRYRAVLVENVPDVVDRWALFDWWVDGMRLLGYNVQFVSVSSAHVGDDDNPYAPQWRDRLYLVFTRTGIPLPDVAPRPRSYCASCDGDVQGVQTWAPSMLKRHLKVGRYRRIPTSSYGQYWYACPTCARRVEPYILPAASAINWSDLGTRMGDLNLKPTTIQRVETGLQMFGQPTLTTVKGNTYERPGSGYLRAWPVGDAPLPTQTCTAAEALTVPPMMVPVGGTWADAVTSATDEPLRTRTANPKGFEAVVTPEPFIAMLRRNGTATSIRTPLATIAAGGTHHALIVPYYTKGVARPIGEPFDTISTRDRFALVTGQPTRPIEVADCLYRMVQPRESLRAQRFPDSYIVTGNQGEQTMQAGNAVSANVAQWIGERVADALDGMSAGTAIV